MKTFRPLRILIPFLALCIGLNPVFGDSPGFTSASSVDEVRSQLEKLPSDNIWWTVNGKDMAWNNKNLHRMFPTVNVYRAGPVRELTQLFLKAIPASKTTKNPSTGL